jgi:hypothetical protein
MSSTTRRKRLDSGKEADRMAVGDKLRRWQTDADLAGLREPEALSKLPADEQASWRKLWADVATLFAATAPGK